MNRSGFFAGFFVYILVTFLLVLIKVQFKFWLMDRGTFVCPSLARMNFVNVLSCKLSNQLSAVDANEIN